MNAIRMAKRDWRSGCCDGKHFHVELLFDRPPLHMHSTGFPLLCVSSAVTFPARYTGSGSFPLVAVLLARVWFKGCFFYTHKCPSHIQWNTVTIFPFSKMAPNTTVVCRGEWILYHPFCAVSATAPFFYTLIAGHYSIATNERQFISI